MHLRKLRPQIRQCREVGNFSAARPSAASSRISLNARFLVVDCLELRYASGMSKRGPLYQLRSYFAGLLGISDERARNGVWWEIDFIIILLLGAFAYGAYAWTQL